MKVLIVEDEAKIARALRLGFEQERSVVEIVDNGADAIASVESDDHDVIVLDRMLPGGMDGIE
ncbi:MAG: response regulator, partial [Candidatus Saccharimonadaceae bacterium]